ncbi:MAG: hypothetical protein ACFFCS_14975 [Candidatus Hodarchaeota archaeon]
MPASQAAYYGFWSISANSPNYIQSLDVPTELYEGDDLLVNGTIISSPLTDSYVDQTNAILTIKYPNGTIWTTQEIGVNSSRNVNFTAIPIPTSGLDYIAGEFTAILSWNNSWAGNPLDECGVAVETFTVRHRANLTAQTDMIYNILNTEAALPIQLRYVDYGGNDITDATISFTNFEGVTQYFTHTTGFYNYLAILNCENGSDGLNALDIQAVSPAFEPKNTTVSVEIVRITNFSIAEFPSASAQWNDNITLKLNYTDAVNGSPIVISDPSNVSVNWDSGYYWVNMNESVNGIYYLHLNTSQKLVGNSYLIPITIKKIGFQGKTIMMDIAVTPRLTSLSVDPIPNLGYGELLFTNALYTESSSSNGITGATVTARIVQGNIPCSVVEDVNGYYNISVDTWLLPGLSTYTLQVNSSWTDIPYYANQTRNIQFKVIQRTTQAYTSGTFDVQSWNTPFNISLFYIDVLNESSINGSDVTITIDAYYQSTPLPAVAAGATIVYDTGIGAWQIELYANDFGNTSISPGFTVYLDVNWTGNVAPYYVNRSLSFTIKIDETPTFLYIEDVSDLTAPKGQVHTVSFKYINQISGDGIDGVENNINITSPLLPNGTIFNSSTDIFAAGNGTYILTFNISDVVGDSASFNISISVQNFQNVIDYTFTLIKITEVPVLELMYIDQVHLGQEMNITLFYRLQGSMVGIGGATVLVSNNPSTNYWNSGVDYTSSYNGTYYNVTLTPSLVHAQVNSEGAYTVFVNFSSAEGTTKLRVNFNVDPIPSNISSVEINGVDETGPLPTSTVYIGGLVNITLVYDDIFNTLPISDGTVELTFGSYTYPLTWNATYTQYTVILDTSIAPFTIGPFVFTATASKGNYTQDTQQIQINILSVATNLTQYLDFVQVNTILIIYGQNFTVSVDYLNKVLNTSIVNPNVSISLTGGAQDITGSRWALNGSLWQAEVNTMEIGAPGTYSLTITAGLTNYQTALAAFVLVIQQIPTELIAYNNSGSLQNSYTIYWGETIDIALIYNNTETGSPIAGATVQPSGAITNSSYSENPPWYNFTFDSSTFGLPNVYVITMSAIKANHTSSSVQITVNVLPITTELRTYNATIQTTSFDQVYGENITVKVLLYDLINSVPVSIVNISTSVPSVVILPVGGEPGNYTVTLNTTNWLTDGIKQFTITGQSTNYVTDSEVITLNILSITTGIGVYINDQDRSVSLQETINYLDSFDITVYFNDTFNTLPVTGATLSLQFTNGSGTYQFPLVPVGGQPGNYTVNLDSSDLGAANQYVLSLSAFKDNYESTFAKINIFLNPIPTALNVSMYNPILINPADTIDVVYTDIVNLNISLISYLEGNSRLNASNTTVEIYTMLSGNRVDATWNSTVNSYSLSINTGNPIYGLDAGFPHGITIFGEASGYQSDSFNLVIDVDLIPTILLVEINQMNLTAAQDAPYYFNGIISFNVSYSRSYGYIQRLPGATVNISYVNDTIIPPVNNDITQTMTEIFLENTYQINITVSLLEFKPQKNKDFKIIATLANHEQQQLTVYLDIEKIDVIVKLETTGLDAGEVQRYPGETIDFRIQLFNNVTQAPFTDLDDVEIVLKIRGDSYDMIPEQDMGVYTGYYHVRFYAPNVIDKYDLFVDITVNDYTISDQYLIPDTTFTLDVVERTGGIDPIWIWILVMALVAVSVWFLLYQIRFKYPPLIRKIHDMRGAVARGKSGEKIKSPKVKNREENIYNHYAQVINEHSFLQTRDSKFAAKSSGYAPVPDDTISLEFELTSLDAGQEPVAVGPKKLKKMVTPTAPTKAPVPTPAARPAVKPSVVTPPKPVTKAPSPAKPEVKKVTRPLPSAVSKPAAKPQPKPAAVKPLTISRPMVKTPSVAPGKPATHESMYQQLVLLEQKRYKAERSLRDLNAKQAKGVITEDEYRQFFDKINSSLEKIKEEITDIRRKLISF